MNGMKKIRRQRLTNFDADCRVHQWRLLPTGKECLGLRALDLRYCLHKLLDGGILALRKDA